MNFKKENKGKDLAANEKDSLLFNSIEHIESEEESLPHPPRNKSRLSESALGGREPHNEGGTKIGIMKIEQEQSDPGWPLGILSPPQNRRATHQP